MPFLPSSHAHWLCSRPGGGSGGGVIMRMRTQALPVLALRATHPQEARQFSTIIPRENRLDLQKSSLRLPEEGRKPRGLGNVGRGADKERSPPPSVSPSRSTPHNGTGLSQRRRRCWQEDRGGNDARTAGPDGYAAGGGAPAREGAPASKRTGSGGASRPSPHGNTIR